MILTLNEAVNIARCLDRLAWADDVLVVDSGSTDGTIEIASRYPNVRIVHRLFDSSADQCNFGLSQIVSEWVLSLDCDYVLSTALVDELRALEDLPDISGYEAGFTYYIHGKPLRAALYPARTVLYRRRLAHYVNEGHTQRVKVEGSIARLKGRIGHDDRKSFSRWIASQQRYARLEVTHLLAMSDEKLRCMDRLRKMGWPAPLVVLLYTMFFKGCAFDGWPGWIYVLQRVTAEALIALEIAERRFGAEETT